jgi:hypothetical protein
MEKVVNGFWYGSELGELEKLCIKSWIKSGYEFYLWVYDLDIEVPENVVIANANHIVTFSKYFTYNEGHTKGTPVAFSNLFRAQLLYQRGGLYVDLDVLCLKPYDFNKRFVFTEQGHKLSDYHVGTCLIYSQDKGEQIFEDWIDWIDSLKLTSVSHGGLGPDLFTKLVIEHGLKEYVLSKWDYCPIDWESYKDIFKYKSSSYGIHLYRSLWTDEDYKNIGVLK